METLSASHPETLPASHSETECPSTQPPLPVSNTQPRVVRPRVPQGPKFSKAYAIVLDEECIRRWARVLYESVFPGELSQLSPEEAEELIEDQICGTPYFMAGQVYEEFPHLPRLKRNIIVINRLSYLGRDPLLPSWLLVFKDNSSQEAIDAPIEPEDIKAVKEFLGVMKQGAKWYDVSRPRRLL